MSLLSLVVVTVSARYFLDGFAIPHFQSIKKPCVNKASLKGLTNICIFGEDYAH